MKKLPKKVTLYFNSNDELVSEEEIQMRIEAGENINKRYHSVEVEFSKDEDEEGTDQITKDIFWGAQKTENALLFVENYEKNKERHKREQIDEDLFGVL